MTKNYINTKGRGGNDIDTSARKYRHHNRRTKNVSINEECFRRGNGFGKFEKTWMSSWRGGHHWVVDLKRRQTDEGAVKKKFWVSSSHTRTLRRKEERALKPKQHCARSGVCTHEEWMSGWFDSMNRNAQFQS